jgi:small subunit ribosomal protein S15
MTTKNTIKKPVWLKYNEAEIKEIVLKIAEKNPGLTTEKIGLVLRDNYGIPTTKIFGFKISDVLKGKNLYESPDLKNLKAKNEKLITHLLKNKQDKKTGRSLIITKAKLKKVTEYLASKNKKQ